jgi:hypothetical protein
MWLLPLPLPPLPSAGCLSFSVYVCVAGRSSLLTGEGDGEGWGRSQIRRRRENHSVLSGMAKTVQGLVVIEKVTKILVPSVLYCYFYLLSWFSSIRCCLMLTARKSTAKKTSNHTGTSPLQRSYYFNNILYKNIQRISVWAGMKIFLLVKIITSFSVLSRLVNLTTKFFILS